jgi:thiol:disulfide interchange protein DsbD
MTTVEERIKFMFINRLAIQKFFKISVYLILMTGFLLASPVQAKDPFEPKLDFNLNEKQPEPLLPDRSNAENPFKLSARAVPDRAAPGQNLTLEVRFDIAPGHQIYADKTAITPPKVPGLRFGAVKSLTPSFEKTDPYQGTIRIYEEKAVFELPVSVEQGAEAGSKIILLKVGYLGCTETVCFLPQEKHLDIPITVLAASESLPDATPPQAVQDYGKPEENPFQKAADRFGAMGVLIAAFIWGFLASLTPCVYPMIPVTVSVIGAGSAGSTSRGLLLSVFYVLGLSLTYAVFGVIAAWSGSLFGEYASHPAVRIIVAGLFVLLALSMFDLLFIQTPSAISSKIGGTKRAGIIGVFLTGAVAGAVVGPCVGPMLVALLVYIAGIGNKLYGFMIMWNFALGMGMLFLVIGTFSGAAASLPKAGAWMEKLKRFFGVLMLAAALYYVEPLLPENIFMLSLGTLLIGIGIFLGAMDPLKAESADRDRFWKAVGIVFLVIGIVYTAKFALNDEEIATQTSSPEPGISWLTDEAVALAQARTQNKPVMMDFSADWCTACKKLERETFSHPSVIKASEQFICVKIDCTDTADPRIKELQNKYSVKGLPTILFINADGQNLPDKTITEFVKPEFLLKRMQSTLQAS